MNINYYHFTLNSMVFICPLTTSPLSASVIIKYLVKTIQLGPMYNDLKITFKFKRPAISKKLNKIDITEK